MSNVIYTSRVRIEQKKRPLRNAHLPATAHPVEFGVHGGIAAHYGMQPESDVAATLDYVVAATGG